MKIYPRILFLFALVLILPLAWAGKTAAQDDDGKQHDQQSGTEKLMEAVERDRLPAENLSPLAATPCVGGMADVYECNNIDLLALMPLSSIGGGNGNDIWGWTDTLDGKEYALMGRTNGAAFVDISDPENPIYLGNLPGHNGSTSTWRDIKVYADYAFIVSEAGGHGMQVFDLTRLRSVPTPPVTFTEDAHYSGFGSAHNIVINEDTGFAYGVGTNTCSGGLHMVDISTPTSPVDAGCFSSDGYTHDAQCVVYNGPDTDHVGDEICFNSNEDTVTIVDVTNKGAPVQLSRTGYSGSAYTHQGWVTEDHNYLLVGDELDEQNFGHNTRTYIWDISDLEAPVKAGVLGYSDGVTTAIDHNLYTKDGIAYESNYRAGLRIMDLADVANGNLSEIAYFDVHPGSNSANFNGTWSNYPYFDSGVVIVSSIERGLFILRPALEPDFRLNVADTSLDVCDPGSDSTTVTISAVNGYTDTVNLSASGLPGGAMANFTPMSIDPMSGSVMSVTVSGTAVGNYSIDVLADDGVISHTESVALNVGGGVPITTTLLGPTDGALDVPSKPLFNWTAVPGASIYHLEVDDDPGFGSIDYSVNVAGVSHMATNSLSPNTLYYWRVTAENACGVGMASAVFSFTTQNIGLFCNGAAVDFEDGIPANFNTSTAGNVYWSTTDDTNACDNGGNQTNGSGNAACADSDQTNQAGAPYDAQMWTNPLNLSASTAVTLTFEAAYNDYGSTDWFKVDVSKDGGSNWTNELSWNSDTTQNVSIDMNAYAGEPNVLIRYHYYGQDWDWYVQVDDIAIECKQAPPVDPITATPVISGTDVNINWNDAGAVGYEVHCVDPGDWYTPPVMGTGVDVGTNTTYPLTNAVASGYQQSCVVANDTGVVVSNRVGVFNYDVLPGTP